MDLGKKTKKTCLAKLNVVLSSFPELKLFDLSRPVVVSVDGSPIGIGDVQSGQPIAYSSTSLTVTQKRYFQIEKELLAVQFTLMRFRQYVYGQSVVVETDQKPLVDLLDNPIASCAPRIRRMCLQLQRFDFKLVYKHGKDLFIADTLSRAPSLLVKVSSYSWVARARDTVSSCSKTIFGGSTQPS